MHEPNSKWTYKEWRAWVIHLLELYGYGVLSKSNFLVQMRLALYDALLSMTGGWDA